MCDLSIHIWCKVRDCTKADSETGLASEESRQRGALTLQNISTSPMSSRAKTHSRAAIIALYTYLLKG